jgi:hypothetical protein
MKTRLELFIKTVSSKYPTFHSAIYSHLRLLNDGDISIPFQFGSTSRKPIRIAAEAIPFLPESHHSAISLIRFSLPLDVNIKDR